MYTTEKNLWPGPMRPNSTDCSINILSLILFFPARFLNLAGTRYSGREQLLLKIILLLLFLNVLHVLSWTDLMLMTAFFALNMRCCKTAVLILFSMGNYKSKFTCYVTHLRLAQGLGGGRGPGKLWHWHNAVQHSVYYSGYWNFLRK